MATTKEIRISQLPLEKDIRGMMTVGVNSANQSVKIPIGEVINEEISKVKRTYGYSRIDALTVGSSADDVATALIAENENKRTMPNVGDVLVDWGGVTRVPVVRQTVQTGGEKPIYSFSFRTADNTATKTVTIQGSLYEPQTVVSVETVKDVTQQQISTLDTQLAEEATARLNQDDVLEAKITEEKNARIAKDDVVFTVTKDTINDAETVGDANWAWALTPSVSDEELNARIAKRANFYVDVSLDTLGFLPYLKYIKLESIPENTNGVFSGLIPPVSEFGYVETTNIKVKYNAKHKRWIALFYGADYIIPTVTSKKNGLMSKSDKAKLDALPTQLTAEQTAREQADKTLQTNIDALKATATADANGLMSKEDKVKLDTKVATKEDIAKERTARTEADKVLTTNLAKEVTDRTNAVNAEATAREQADTAINGEIQGIKDKGTLHDLFLRYGAKYDQSKQKYILNGLELDFNQTLTSWVESSMIWNAESYANICNSTKMLTNFRPVNLKNFSISINMSNMFAYSAIKVVDLTLLNKYKSRAKLTSNMFLNNNTLMVLKGLNVNDVADLTSLIYNCPKLEYVELDYINADLPIPNSPLLKKESILYLLQHAKPNKAITITLHPTAYAMATADPEIQAELEKQPNISLAEGEPTA